MLGLSQASLAEMAGISTTGLNNIEKGHADPKMSTMIAIRTALESAGVQFVDDGDVAGGKGVVLNQSSEGAQ